MSNPALTLGPCGKSRTRQILEISGAGEMGGDDLCSTSNAIGAASGCGRPRAARLASSTAGLAPYAAKAPPLAALCPAALAPLPWPRAKLPSSPHQ